MAKRAFAHVNWTATAVADTTNMVNTKFQVLKGGSATQRLEIEEVYMAGTTGTSNVAVMQVARDSTVVATPTALAAPDSDGPMEPQAEPPTAAPVAAVAATTLPQRSASITTPRLNLGFNAFGGIVRWVAAPYERFIIYGTAVNVGEASLSNFTGGGTDPTLNSHIVYELV